MITYKKLLGNHTVAEVPIAHQHNLEDLLKAVNKLRDVWGKPMFVTSGYRSLQDHLRIYSQKGITDQSKIPMKSNHLSGAAVDISDPDGKLMSWVKDNIPLLETAGLWCEDGTVGWVHFQINPPRSGNRFFKP